MIGYRSESADSNRTNRCAKMTGEDEVLWGQVLNRVFNPRSNPLRMNGIGDPQLKYAIIDGPPP